MAVTETPATGFRVEFDNTLRKIPPGWPRITHLVDAEGVVAGLGKTYWYAVKVREATATVNRTATIAVRLIKRTSFYELIESYLVLRLRTPIHRNSAEGGIRTHEPVLVELPQL